MPETRNGWTPFGPELDSAVLGRNPGQWPSSSELVFEVADKCLQLHGGWSYVEELPIARAFRDQRVLRIGAGTTEVLRYYIAKLMGF